VAFALTPIFSGSSSRILVCYLTSWLVFELYSRYGAFGASTFFGIGAASSTLGIGAGAVYGFASSILG
tara:strand:+ start:444 stop:647 length:204 start_codon:yes stop_codon:yes gene_type:complete